MNASVRFARHLFLVSAVFASGAGAQTGSGDQISPVGVGAQSANFNGASSSLTWQAQVRAGLPGLLEGFTLQLQGVQGATVSVAVRLGPAWNTTPAVFQAIVSKATNGVEAVFVDVTSANINLGPGTLFVIEMQGHHTGNGVGILGSHVTPPAVPLYPEPLFLDVSLPGCYDDCGWRFAFITYVLDSAGTPYCFGDGTGMACPCGNNGTSGHGCASSVNASGAQLGATGFASLSTDTLRLTGSGMSNSSALYFQGTTQISFVFGDGLRCAGGQVIRLGTKVNVSGSSHFPAAGDPAISVRGLVPLTGGLRNYQVWYRNAAAFCTPLTFNLTNGVAITWTL